MVKLLAKVDSRVPYELKVTGSMPSLLYESTRHVPKIIRDLGPLSLFPVRLKKTGDQNAYFITRLTPNALRSSVSIVYTTVLVPSPLFEA